MGKTRNKAIDPHKQTLSEKELKVFHALIGARRPMTGEELRDAAKASSVSVITRHVIPKLNKKGIEIGNDRNGAGYYLAGVMFLSGADAESP